MRSENILDLVRSANPVPAGALDTMAAAQTDALLERLRAGEIRAPALTISDPSILRPGRSRALRWRRSRSLALAGVLAAAAVVVATAFGAANRLVGLFEGTPAPPLVQKNFIRWHAMANARNYALAQAGLAADAPTVDSSQAHGVLTLQIGDGAAYLWAAPRTDGGECWLLQFGDAQTPDGTANGASACSARSTSPQITDGTYITALHPSLRILLGHAAGAASVDLQLAEGTSTTLQVVEDYFLAALDTNVKVTKITAYDANGAELATTTTP